METFGLSFHATYRCASSGACCTSGWDIAVEPEVEARLRDALRTRSLRVVAEDPLRAPHGRTILAHDTSGRCAFYEPDRRSCAIHRRLGHDALPVSCRLFPRVCLLTPRGVLVSLSHYCPTAAALLFSDDAPPAVVTNPPAFPATAHYEGLDARDAPPPLLRPGVWLGWDGHERWQRHVIEVLGHTGPPEAALARLSAQAEQARAWTVDRGPFPEFLESVLAQPSRGMPAPSGDVLCAEVLSAIPPPLRPAPAGPIRDVALDGFEAPLRRYLAARAFASWTAIQGSGLRTAVRALQAALALVRREVSVSLADGRSVERLTVMEAIRRADLLLVHLASPEDLAVGFSRCETDRPPP
jgi:Fe-S-cluster containining protein